MPSNILTLEFDNTESNAAAVKRLLPTIEYYRGKKKTLVDIHRALSKLGEISMCFGSFKNSYYSQREKSSSQPTGGSNLASQKIEKTDGQDVKSENIESPAPRKIAVGNLSLAEELAEHQAQAAAVFQNK